MAAVPRAAGDLSLQRSLSLFSAPPKGPRQQPWGSRAARVIIITVTAVTVKTTIIMRLLLFVNVTIGTHE